MYIAFLLLLLTVGGTATIAFIVYILHQTTRKNYCCVCYEGTVKYLKGFDLHKTMLGGRITPQKLGKADLLICYCCLQGMKSL